MKKSESKEKMRNLILDMMNGKELKKKTQNENAQSGSLKIHNCSPKEIAPVEKNLVICKKVKLSALTWIKSSQHKGRT